MIELMVVVAIIGIIFFIASPSYFNYVKKTNRASAQACLVELSQILERRYATSYKYNNNKLDDDCIKNLSDYYTVTSSLQEHSYLLKASPTSRQADSSCGTLTYNQQFTKGLEAASTSGSSVTGTIDNCWG